MKKVRLTEDLLGRKKGEIIEIFSGPFMPQFSALRLDYKEGTFTVPINSPLFEKVETFLTDDGIEIEILEDNKLWVVSPKTFRKANISASDNSEYDSGFKRFSTEEAANEYILFNTVCFSLVDLMRRFTDLTEVEKVNLIQFANDKQNK